MTDKIDRRVMLKASAAVAAAAALTGPAFSASAKPYRVGVIGAGWFGKLDLSCLMQVAPVEVVAIADVDQHMLGAAWDQIHGRKESVAPAGAAPALYHDFREMLAKHAFDIVIVATPDHWHALAMIAAVEKGAHVYCEKPVSVDIVEGKAMVAAAKKHNRLVQAGTQRRTSAFMIEARDKIVRGGRLGKIGHVEMFGYFHQRLAHTDPVSAPPDWLDWNFYCGPAPVVPYRDGIHPVNWRSFRAFGNGYMGDIGVHFIDTCRWMLDLGWAKRISSSGGIYVDTDSAATVPDTQVATFEYDNLIMTWTNRQWSTLIDPNDQWGAHIYGERGTLKLTADSYSFLPAAGNGEPSGASRPLEYDKFPSDHEYRGDWESVLVCATRDNMRDFVHAIETGTQPASNMETAYISTSMAILANMSQQLGRTLAWDAGAQRIVGDEEANRMLARPYRAPWVHPSV